MHISAINRRAKRLKRIPAVAPEKVTAALVILYIAIALFAAFAAANLIPDEAVAQHEASSRRMLNTGFFIGAGMCFGYAVLLRARCGRLSGDIIWPVLGAALLMRGIAVHFSFSVFGAGAMDEDLYTVVHAFCLAVLLLLLAVQTAIAVNCFVRCPRNVDALIVHGARSGSSVVLARADAAGRYLARSTSSFAIASGGRGADETESEARCIADRIAAGGIDPGRILLEEESRTTRENLECSAKLLPPEAVRVAVVTDDYHVFRAKCMARAVLRRRVYGLPVHSSYVSLPHSIIREYLSILKHCIKGDLAD